MNMSEDSIGVWLIGAFGTVATTVVVGAKAIAAGIAPRFGLLTESSDLGPLAMPSTGSLRFGGHEIRPTSFEASASEIARRNGSIHEPWIDSLKDELAACSKEVRPGIATGGGKAIESLQDGAGRDSGAMTARHAVDSIEADLEAFRRRHGLKRLVVINLASTEPPPPEREEYQRLDALEKALDRAKSAEFRPGLLYAYAAFKNRAAFVNFTASKSCVCPALDELARKLGVPYAGSDGKTGETLVKSALAPMFGIRRLHVDSWTGFNILGNRDGQVLSSEENRKSKVDSKDGVISGILGYAPQTVVGIHFVESLWDNKVAWDHIHFRGFLGYPMSMQFTWQGCDSILAAPLVLDLIRFADLALRRGESGPLVHLASFFKSPVGTTEHDLARQSELLQRYISSALPS
jgi:myo-inositol-1-phosphate synthase